MHVGEFDLREGLAEILLYASIPLVFATVFVLVVLGLQWVQRRQWSDQSRRIFLYRGPLSIALLVMGTGLAFTVYHADAGRLALHEEGQTHFLERADHVDATLTARFTDLDRLLHGVSAMVLSRPDITAADFRSYARAAELGSAFDGVRGVGYVARKLQDSGAHPDLLVVAYLEPAGVNADVLGRNIGANPMQRAAAEAAMRSGQAALVRSNPLQAGSADFLYLVPVYREGSVPVTEEERVQALRGWAFAPLRLAELAADDKLLDPGQINFQLFDRPELDAASLVYDSVLPGDANTAPTDRLRAVSGSYSVVRPVLLADQVFYVRSNSTAAFDAAFHSRDHLSGALLGSSLSVLLAMVLWLLMAGRKRALELASAMTSELERLAMVARRTSNAVYFTDTEWRITWVNEGFTRMCGFTPEDALGLRPSQLLHSPLGDPDTGAIIDLQAEAGERVEIQVLQRSKQGQDYWADLEVLPILAANGRISGYLSVQSDITEVVRAKAALQVEKERTENILSGTLVGTWESNLQTGEQLWNERWSTMLGFSRDEVLPTADEFWHQRLHHADLARFNTATANCIIGATDHYSCELRALRKDGSWMWILARAKVMTRTRDGRAEWIGGIHTDITESKQVELSLREMEAFLDRAGRIASVGAWQIDLRTREVLFSAQTCAIHGMAPDFRPTEKVALSFYPRADRRRLRDAVRKAEQDGTPWDMVVEFINAQGQQSWVRIFGEVSFDDNGPERLVGAFQDVTKVHLAQLEVERSGAELGGQQRRLQAILEGTHVGTWEWNVHTGESIYNDQYVAMLGYTLEELEPLGYNTWARLVHPEDLVASAICMQEHLRGERPVYEMEVRMRHKLGHWLWVLGRGKLTKSQDDGDALWVYGTHMDITERKQAEQQLAQTTSTLQNVLDSATAVGVVSLGLDQRIQVFNKGAENLLGFDADELIGRHSAELFFEPSELAALSETLELVWGHAPNPQEVFEHVLHIREAQEWTLLRKNGSRFKASLIFSPMVDEGGALVGNLCMIYDVSRQKEYEASLREAMRLAEQSSVSKSQFLANMSHEIRTPMNAILGMLQLLRNTALHSNQRDYAEKAAGAARSLLGLLNDILDFSKVEAGKMQLDPEPFLVERLLADLSVILSSNLGSKNVDLVFDVDPAIPPELVGDAMRLKQVLINLGGNAVKFTETGQVVIRWTLVARTPERVMLTVAVVDSGIGIAPENQERIFTAFTQAEANTTRRFGGTGLGLVISTRLIRLMGGELQLSSVVDQGSCFSFTIELGVTQFSPLPALPGQGPAPVRAMLVDDNPQALATSTALMQSLGWEVTAAASGEQALARIKALLDAHQALPDALFVDWQMPGMDGWETLRNVRRLCATTKPPLLILLSRQSRDALAQRTDREQELLNGFMVKPFTASMFERSLEQARDGSSTQESPLRILAPRLAGMRVLLVEDNPINQQVAQELLAAEGALVTLADNGRLGVDAVHSASPAFDAVLMDLQMPVMDGLRATRLLRANPRWAQLPVIAMTANAMSSDRDECLAAGMNDHVGKPFDINRLVQTLIQHTRWEAQPATTLARPGPLSEALAMPAAIRWPAGIDGETALARMGGNAALLQRSMVAFVGDAERLQQRLEQALQIGDLEQAQRELHAFKGLSATMGVRSLSELAARAEKLVQLPERLPEYQVLVLQLWERLAFFLPELESAAAALTPVQDATLSAQRQTLGASDMQQLKDLLLALQASDMAAMEMHASLRQGQDESLAATMEPLDTAMSDLEFEEAALACESLVRQFETTPGLSNT